MLMTELIRFKRDGGVFSPNDIRELIRAYTTGEVPEYQMAAMLMAVCWRGLDPAELAVWTESMIHSGEVVDLSSVPGAKVDKHSTGGVGDKISIPLAPLVAACGVRVPMISGRGLGHTGGTLDKMESIPGLRTDLSMSRFIRGVGEVGCCIIGQTDALVPADRKMYALRDVTGTVESVPLISASIMSKKLAEGIGGLVLDVKFGSGAFMKTVERARELARTMVGIGNRNGVRTMALLTSMDQPIGWNVGNALEIEESVEVLKNRGPADTRELVITFGAWMLVLGGGVAADYQECRLKIQDALASGAGLERFRHMIEFQGGDPRVVDHPMMLRQARSRKDVVAGQNGFVSSIDCEKVGLASLVIGGGRKCKEDTIDPAVGLRVYVKLGMRLTKGQPIATICYNDPAHVDEAEALIQAAYVLGDESPEVGPLVLDVVE